MNNDISQGVGVDRRTALKLGAGMAVSAWMLDAKALGAYADGTGLSRGGEPFVRDDIGRLGRVLVHSLTEDEYAVDRTSSGLIPHLDSEPGARVRQHAELLGLLRRAGAEPVELADALAGAVEEARRRGFWRTWLSAAHPRLSGEADTVTAATLLGRDRDRQYLLDQDGAYLHLFDDTGSTTWTRDASFMTPKGLVVCNARSHRRLRENMTLRFALMHSPLLADFPVVFDAVAEGVILEGGDAQMVDENTLFLGYGQRSDPRAAPMLARRLEMDVLAVRINKADFLRRVPSGIGPAVIDLRVLFLHLDTFFTHVNHQHALAVPWLLEAEHAGNDPLSRYIRGARSQLAIEAEDAEKALGFLKELGKVSLFRAGSGEREDLGDMKLLDYVRAKGYKVTYTGGREPDDSQEGFRAFMAETLGEQRRQASNVVATAPGEVIAYAGSPRTKEALERDGVRVSTFEARELWAGHGGPHCLTMPLERG
ncbi:MAG: hypothetical protein LAT64_14215 [Phycisphaerales bacterium]|nr:hypothetical protein [Planctomycetota bacterium]MCH8509906.1 hypothetical protein [Phycisphaerales bacterium]